MERYYHYTSISTLYKMLDKSIVKDESTGVLYLQLYASHISTLNDTSERNLFILPFMEKVKEYAATQKTALTREQEEELRKMCFSDAYVISLSDSNDDLGMWRGYGGNGSGVCLELDFSQVTRYYNGNESNQYIMEDKYDIKKCEYKLPQEIKMDIQSDTALIQKTYQCLQNYNENNNENTIKRAGIIKQITEKAMLCKHKAYEAEKEWRFIQYEGIPLFHENGEPIRKSYVIKSIPLCAITSVMIGPCIRNSRAIICLEQYLRVKLGKGTQIAYSQIPYRG